MYLKSLVLKGFKSFVDRSVMEFEPGVSVIVGPNGSGKSNISDAVLWVLGDMNPKHLRVRSMEELIFSGSSAREPVAVAEVDLVLDNSDGTLPVEFDEVVITRRMFRNGESEYFINNSPCRRMDIIDILYDSGIGQGAHSIISQGKLTRILESSPQDRRALVEEAAGILKHKKRKEKAARKLAKMDASLERVNDVVKIIDSRLKPLERQAVRAQQYTELSRELQELELSLSVDDLRLLQAQWNEIDKQEREIEAEQELVQYRLEERESELSRRQLALEEKGLFAGDLNEQRIRCQSVIQRLDSGMLVLEEKGKNLVDRSSDLRRDIYADQHRLEEAQKEYQEAIRIADEADARIDVLYAQFRDLTKSGEAITAQRKQAEEDYSAKSGSLRKYENALAEARSALDKAQDSLGSFDTEEALIKDHYGHFEEELESTRTLLSERHARYDGLETELVKAQNEANLATSDIDKRTRLVDAAHKDHDAHREALNAIRAEIQALEEVDKAFVSASPALTWIMDHKAEFTGTLTPISEAFKAQDGYESLVERLLGADLFGLIVEDTDAANLIAERLTATTEDGRIALLPLASARVTSTQPVVGRPLLDFLEYPVELETAAQALFGDVYVVDTVAQALAAQRLDGSGSRFATIQGAVVWPNGKLTLGTQANDAQGILARKRRLETLRKQEGRAVKELEAAAQALEQAEEALQLAQQDGFEVSTNVARIQGDLDATRDEVARLEQSVTDMTAKQVEAQEKLEEVALRRSSTAPLVDEYRQRMDTLVAEIEALKAEVEAANNALLEQTKRKNEFNEQITAVKVELETCKSNLTFKQSNRDKLKREVAALERSLKESQNEALKLDAACKRVDPLYQLYKELREVADVWAVKLRDQAQLEQTDSTNLRKIISEANEACDAARQELQGINERLNQVRIEKARIEAQVENAITTIVANGQTTLEKALEVPSPEDRATAEDRIARLRKRIDNMGAVNQVAMSEYELLKERRDYVMAQVEDLQEARKALSRISAALDRKMHRQFLDTFEVVNNNYTQIFETLFPGGSGSLSLINTDDPEELGIEVNAQPRGKRITTLSLMSGGEQSLVALAFLIAIYRCRKVPFYIFDEVEAALDDTNLRVLIEYLSQMRNETQIIMISHQRRTMEMADVLYGVSMQAAGISKLVSQRLEQALAAAEEYDTGYGSGYEGS